MFENQETTQVINALYFPLRVKWMRERDGIRKTTFFFDGDCAMRGKRSDEEKRDG